MNKRNEEMEISLVDMFWSICLKWRVMIMWGLIIALIAGGIGYYNATKETDIEKLEKEFEEEDEIYVDMYLAYTELYDHQKAYNEYSPLMQLDSDNFYVNVLTYYVDDHFVVEYPVIDKRDNLGKIIRAYETSFSNEDFIDKLMEVTGLAPKARMYCTELVDLWNQYGDVYVNGSDFITITIYGETPEDCGKVATLVKDTIAAQTESIAKEFGEHDITLIDDITKKVSDIDLATRQKNNITNLDQYNTTLKNYATNLSDAALSYVNVVSHTDEEEEVAKPSPINVKLIIIGFIIGAFLVAFVVALGYIFNKKLRPEDDYEAIFGIKLLGNISGNQSNKKKLFGFVDKWLIKKRHVNMHKFTPSEEEDMVVSNMKLLAKKSDTTNLYLTGSTISDIAEDLMDTFVKRLGKDGIQLTIGKSIIYNADALEDASEIGSIVIIDKAGTVMYNEIYNMLDTCETHKIKVLGGVVVW